MRGVKNPCTEESAALAVFTFFLVKPGGAHLAVRLFNTCCHVLTPALVGVAEEIEVAVNLKPLN